VVHLNLGGLEILGFGKKGNEAMHLPGEPQRMGRLSAHRLKAAINVVQPKPAEDPNDAVKETGTVNLMNRIPPHTLPAAYQIPTFTEFTEQERNLTGIVLQIAIHRNYKCTPGYCETSRQRCRLAIVSSKPDKFQVSHIPERDEGLPTAISATVIYTNHLIVIFQDEGNAPEQRL
jgi:hypothetical protein